MTAPPVRVDGLDPLLAAVDGGRMATTVASLAGEWFAGARLVVATGWLAARTPTTVSSPIGDRR